MAGHPPHKMQRREVSDVRLDDSMGFNNLNIPTRTETLPGASDPRPEGVRQAMDNMIKANGPKPGKKTKGKMKIKIGFIKDKLRRYTTFSKRKTGIMKKAYELATLTGTEVMVLVASETGHVYTFATKKLQPMITSDSGKSLIQSCLNSSNFEKAESPDEESDDNSEISPEVTSPAAVSPRTLQRQNTEGFSAAESQLPQYTGSYLPQHATTDSVSASSTRASNNQPKPSDLPQRLSTEPAQRIPTTSPSIFAFPSAISPPTSLAAGTSVGSASNLVLRQTPDGLRYVLPEGTAANTPLVFNIPASNSQMTGDSNVMTISIPVNVNTQSAAAKLMEVVGGWAGTQLKSPKDDNNEDS